MSETLDQAVINFSKDSLLLLNVCIALIMFGVALELKVEHFKALFRTPRSILAGLLSQAVLLPALSFLLILLFRPMPSVALGMILVASCPGGNVSNFYCSLARGNVALSVSLTAIMSVSAVILTPLNFALWGSIYGPTAELLEEVNLNIWSMIQTVLLILAVPLAVGMTFTKYLPNTTQKITKPIKRLSILIFAGFVIVALSSNLQNILDHVLTVALLVFVHNAAALALGFGTASIFRLSTASRRSVAIETGIQNTGLGLVIIFDFFQGMGGMAFTAAWWGVWHLISGALISFFWSRRAY